MRKDEKESCRREFFEKFNEEFFRQLENGAGMLEVFGKRPQERWLYGFIGQALSTVLKDEKSSFVLTEVPVARSGKSTPGRVDFIFQFQGHLFLVEVKASVCSLPCSEKRLITLGEIWKAAKQQLHDINLVEYKNRKLSHNTDTKRSIRLPLFLVTCGNTGNKEKLAAITDVAEEIGNLKNRINKKLKAEFVEARPINREPFSHISEKEYISGSKKMRREYGWLLFAGMAQNKK